MQASHSVDDKRIEDKPEEQRETEQDDCQHKQDAPLLGKRSDPPHSTASPKLPQLVKIICLSLLSAAYVSGVYTALRFYMPQSTQEKKEAPEATQDNSDKLRSGWRYVSNLYLGETKKLPWFEAEKNVGSNMTKRKFVNTIPPAMMLLPLANNGSKAMVLFCPNAKAGTSTIIKTLHPKFPPNRRRCGEACSLSAWASFKNAEKRSVIRNPRTLSFTHVRNPWDRIRSTFEGKIKRGKIQYTKDMSKMSFVQFVRYVKQRPLKDFHWMPYWRRCFTSPNSKGQVFHYDHIIRLEDGVSQGLEEVFRDAGVEIAVYSKMFNRTGHSVNDRTEYYKKAAELDGITLDDLVSLVGQIYEKDISRFGYDFYKYN